AYIELTQIFSEKFSFIGSRCILIQRLRIANQLLRRIIMRGTVTPAATHALSPQDKLEGTVEIVPVIHPISPISSSSNFSICYVSQLSTQHAMSTEPLASRRPRGHYIPKFILRNFPETEA